MLLLLSSPACAAAAAAEADDARDRHAGHRPSTAAPPSAAGRAQGRRPRLHRRPRHRRLLLLLLLLPLGAGARRAAAAAATEARKAAGSDGGRVGGGRARPTRAETRPRRLARLPHERRQAAQAPGRQQWNKGFCREKHCTRALVRGCGGLLWRGPAWGRAARARAGAPGCRGWLGSWSVCLMVLLEVHPCGRRGGRATGEQQVRWW